MDRLGVERLKREFELLVKGDESVGIAPVSPEEAYRVMFEAYPGERFWVKKLYNEWVDEEARIL